MKPFSYVCGHNRKARVYNLKITHQTNDKNKISTDLIY